MCYRAVDFVVPGNPYCRVLIPNNARNFLLINAYAFGLRTDNSLPQEHSVQTCIRIVHPPAFAFRVFSSTCLFILLVKLHILLVETS